MYQKGGAGATVDSGAGWLGSENFREGSSLPLGEDGERKPCLVTARNASMLASFMSGLIQATVI